VTGWVRRTYKSGGIIKMGYKFNLKKDDVDWRDLVYIPTNDTLKDNVDLRKWATPVEDQSQLGSCTSNAIVGAYELTTLMKLPAKTEDISRLFIYYNTRTLDGTVQEDSGATVRGSLKSIKADGACAETLWPYDISKFTVMPTADCYTDAKKRNIKDYFRIMTIENMLDALNNNKPVVFGMLVYEEFLRLSPTNTILTAPTKPRWAAIGAHAMVLVGYDLPARLFLVRNSFGTSWGMDGYCWISFDYISTQAQDVWVFSVDIDGTVI
jgi:C1A family cysteine protease